MKNNRMKMTLLLIAFSAITNLSAFFAPSDNPGANAFGGAATGAMIGGLAGGGRGAGIGAGVGLGVGLLSSAAASDNRRSRDRYYNDRNQNRGYNPNSRSSMRDYIAQIERENQDLRNENYDLMRQLNAGRR